MTDKNRFFKTTVTILTAVLLMICPALCRAETVSGTDAKSSYSVWYLDTSETGLKTASYEPAAENKEAMVPELIGILNGTEVPSGCRTVLALSLAGMAWMHTEDAKKRNIVGISNLFIPCTPQKVCIDSKKGGEYQKKKEPVTSRLPGS